MAFLGRSKKVDLQCLAEELGETVTKDMKVVDLKKKILGSTEYEEEFVKELLERIVNEREEEIKRQNELENDGFQGNPGKIFAEALVAYQYSNLKTSTLLYGVKEIQHIKVSIVTNIHESRGKNRLYEAILGHISHDSAKPTMKFEKLET
ncbi:unnamed protein product [Larinioides sclopetarius]|uniref:Uncharacterized protein n=1 Tax=Larinioides sclopetarius TaxID=280406 RepID=A0AAV2ADK8_9ARAC